jgi:hypothetical protein
VDLSKPLPASLPSAGAAAAVAAAAAAGIDVGRGTIATRRLAALPERLAAPEPALGSWIDVLWEATGAFFRAHVIAFNATSRTHRVHYVDDNTYETICLQPGLSSSTVAWRPCLNR